MLTETDEELLKDLRVDYLPHYKHASYQCMETYEQERRLAADLIDRLRAENAKMREALEKIAKEQSGVTAFQVADWFQQIAREALEPK